MARREWAWSLSRLAEGEGYQTKTYCEFCGQTYDIDTGAELIARHIKECPKHPMRDVESQLTQRTAELEAAKKVKADYDRWLSGGVYFTTAEYMAHLDKHHAELERVREELKSAEAGYFVAERDLQGANNKYDELRTLLLSLPKVEGEIRVDGGNVISVEPIRGADPPLWWRRTIATFKDGLLAKHCANALKYRQGME